MLINVVIYRNIGIFPVGCFMLVVKTLVLNYLSLNYLNSPCPQAILKFTGYNLLAINIRSWWLDKS